MPKLINLLNEELNFLKLNMKPGLCKTSSSARICAIYLSAILKKLIATSSYKEKGHLNSHDVKSIVC